MNVPIPDSGQLDLFLHSRAVVLANDVADALLARDMVCAADCLGRLRAEEPDHRVCRSLEVLCDVLREWPLPSASAEEIDKAIRRLESDAHPAALAAMGDKAAKFLRDLWRDLAQAGGARVYDSAFPESYRAALCLRCGDAQSALTAAEAIAGCDHNIDALHWLAVARYRLGDLDACRMPLMRVALLGPELFPRTLAEIDDPLLERDWNAFQAACHWLDPDERTTGAWFPAWHLLEHPGIRFDCGGPTILPATRAARTFFAIARLLELETHGYSSALISARSELRSLDPNMFDFYMARRNALTLRVQAG